MLSTTLKYLSKPATFRLSLGPTAATLSLFQQQTRPELDRLKEQFMYLKEYSYLDLTSRYKSWMELDPEEKDKFMERYIGLHERRVVHRHHPNSVRNALKQMDKENKDIGFMFFYLYEGLKDLADKQMAKNREMVIMDDTYDLLVKRDADLA